jgi:hypothetical protein
MKKDMKQTVEEAARDAIHAHYKCNGEYPCGERDYCEHCNGHNTAFDCCECGADEFKEGFISGAEWQSKQSPWISVNERLPEPNKEVLLYDKNPIRHYVIGWLRKDKGYNKGMWALSNGWIEDKDITHWMPIDKPITE